MPAEAEEETAAAAAAAAAECSRVFCREFVGERKGEVLALRIRWACSCSCWWAAAALCRDSAGLRAPVTKKRREEEFMDLKDGVLQQLALFINEWVDLGPPPALPYNEYFAGLFTAISLLPPPFPASLTLAKLLVLLVRPDSGMVVNWSGG